MDIIELMDQIRKRPDCELHPACGLPVIPKYHLLPRDVEQFYQRCGGCRLFQLNDLRSIDIAPPSEVKLANPVIFGEDLAESVKEEISADWYIIATDGQDQFVTIDLSPRRNGRCYDSFWDHHAMRGSSPIIAFTFTELLFRMLGYDGNDFYWNDPQFTPFGDAYELD